MTDEAFTIVPAAARQVAFSWAPAELWLVAAGAGYQVRRDGDYAGWQGALVAVRTRSGTGELLLDGGVRLVLEPGTLLLVPDTAIRRYRTLSAPWRFSWLVAWPAGAPPFELRKLYRTAPLPDEEERLEAVLKGLREPDDLLRSLAAVRALELLHRWLASAENAETPGDPGITAALRRAWRRPGRVSVRELARTARMTERHFRRRFRETVGMPPKRYLDRLRLEQAAGLLRRGGMSIKEVAAHCGFSSPFHFSAAFRKQFGFPPSKLHTAVAADQDQRQQEEE